MHFCTAHVAIGGDERNIMYRDEFAPVSWPEIDVLREIHGGASVTNVRPFVDVPQAARAERDRLAARYGDKALEDRWGGKNPPTELRAEGAKPRPGIVWLNPLSGRTEKTTETGSEPYTIPPEARPVAEIVGNYEVRQEETRPDEPKDEMYHDDPEDDPTAFTEPPPKRKK